jgi:hypothetical protein
MYSGILAVGSVEFDIPEQKIGTWKLPNGAEFLFLKGIVLTNTSRIQLINECIGQRVLDGLEIVDFQHFTMPASQQGYPITILFGMKS